MPEDGKRTEDVQSQCVVNRFSVGGFIHRLAKSRGHAVSMDLNMTAIEPVEPNLRARFYQNQCKNQYCPEIGVHSECFIMTAQQEYVNPARAVEIIGSSLCGMNAVRTG